MTENHPDQPGPSDPSGQQYPSYGAPQGGQPGQPPAGQNPYGQNPYGQNPYGQPGYGAPVRDHPQAVTILVLGIVGLVLCGLAGPFAWVMGGKARKEIQASNGQLGGSQQVTIGWVLGIISSALLVVSVIVFIGILGVFASTAP